MYPLDSMPFKEQPYWWSYSRITGSKTWYKLLQDYQSTFISLPLPSAQSFSCKIRKFFCISSPFTVLIKLNLVACQTLSSEHRKPMWPNVHATCILTHQYFRWNPSCQFPDNKVFSIDPLFILVGMKFRLLCFKLNLKLLIKNCCEIKFRSGRLTFPL